MTLKQLDYFAAMSRVNAARTPSVALVLDEVRASGRSAHPQRGDTVGAATATVAIRHGLNPYALQADVQAYADASAALITTAN